MKLCVNALPHISAARLEVPQAGALRFPEKVLQFGTGVLLRGLPDYFIDKANKQNVFQGRVLVVKSTANGGTDAFAEQDHLYTQCIKGIENGQLVEENIVNASISRVLSAKSDWDEILEAAANPDMELVISNTTEVGIVLQKDNIHGHPPDSFPGKLLAFLYRRFRIFKGDPAKGMVIVPTELIPENGSKLESIITELAHQNALEPAFIDWLEQHNHFCNSLVDRIVPGKLPIADQQKMEQELGYTDELMIMSEVYRLWAIEAKHQRVFDVLQPLASVDEGIVLTPDIHLYRELKVRLLNGPHTFACGIAVLTGVNTVKEAMDHPLISAYIARVMEQEITPAIVGEELTKEKALDFAARILDRFRNPHIEHRWISITMNYSSKMEMRNVPAIVQYIERQGAAPQAMALGFAAFLCFMKGVEGNDGKYYGTVNGAQYVIQDDNAGLYAESWKKGVDGVVGDVLGNETFGGSGLADALVWRDAVAYWVREIVEKGVVRAMEECVRGEGVRLG